MNYFEFDPSMADEVARKGWASEVAKSIKPPDPESYPIITKMCSREEILFYETHKFKRPNSL